MIIRLENAEYKFPIYERSKLRVFELWKQLSLPQEACYKQLVLSNKEITKQGTEQNKLRQINHIRINSFIFLA